MHYHIGKYKNVNFVMFDVATARRQNSCLFNGTNETSMSYGIKLIIEFD